MTLQASPGNTVKVHYTGKLKDGRVFDSTRERDPLQIELGAGQVIPGFERAVLGMAEGETKSVELAPSDGYGPRRSDMVVEISRQRVPADFDPNVGQQIQLYVDEQQSIPATVVETSDQSITVDANHPLAGEELTFDLQLVEIV